MKTATQVPLLDKLHLEAGLRLSKLHLPVTYSYKELMESVNRIYEKSLYYDFSFTNNNNDNIKVFSYKTKQILVMPAAEGVRIEVPVRVEVSYLFKAPLRLNLLLFKKEFDFEWVFDFVFDIFVTFDAKITFLPDLSLISKTTFKYDWLTYPYLSLGPFNFRVTKQVKPIVERVLQSYAEDKIDYNIENRVALKRILNQVWDNAKKPFLLFEAPQLGFSLWGQAGLKHMVMNGPFFAPENISFIVSPRFYSLLGFDPKTTQAAWQPTPFSISNFLYLPLEREETELLLLLRLPLATLQQLIFKQLSAKKYFFGEAETRMWVREIYFSSKGSQLSATLFFQGVGGSALTKRMKMNLRGLPTYDSVTKRFFIKELDYELESESLLVLLGDQIRSAQFKAQLSESLQFSLAPYEAQLLKKVQAQLKDLSLDDPISDKVIFRTELNALYLDHLFVRDNTLFVFATAKGNFSLALKDLF